jgi:hypothetical protein
MKTCCFVMTRSGNEVILVYQVQDAWCIYVGLQEKMDKCVTYLKNNWVGNCLSEAFIFLPNGPPPPKLKVCGMTFHNMQRKEDESVNPLIVMGRHFWGRKQVNQNTTLKSTYKCLQEHFIAMLPLDICPILACI